ncbi:MAG: AraC family transcriptional regulator [Polyangiaceae bacterium]
MKPPRDEPSIPAVQALHLAKLVRRWGITPAALLRGSDLDERGLTDPSKKLGVSELVQLVERARALTGEPGLGLYFGLRMQIASHGYLGFAAMTASTVGEALSLAVQFAPMLTTAFSLHLHRSGTVAALVLDEEVDLGAARDAVLLALFVGIWRIGCTLTGRELAGRADLAIREPAYFARFRATAPNVSFGQPKNQLVFDAAALDYPLATADPAALELAREQCERAIEALGFEGRVVGRARAAIPKAGGGFRSLDEIAVRLKVSTRTLKRRLASAGTSYSTLLDEARLERARELLRTERRSIDEIAESLGYSDVANFTRAFRRWTGTTPAAHRRTFREKTAKDARAPRPQR